MEISLIGLNPISEGKSHAAKEPCGVWKSGRNPQQEPRPTSRIYRQVNLNLRKISENLGPQLRNSYKTNRIYVKLAQSGRRPSIKIRIINNPEIENNED